MSAWFWSDDCAVTSIEYGLLGMLIAVVVAPAVSAIGLSLKGLYASVASASPPAGVEILSRPSLPSA